MKNAISPTIQRLFWDMDIHKLDTNTHKKTIIERILNDGNLSDWRWLVSVYGNQNIKEALGKKYLFERNNIRTQARLLAGMLVK